ncbi:MAG: plasmid mobilization relaxosome protein MobC [Dorea sp.]|nr:plasmid mobilization relaxosome protein MobC [Dorea sp.]
MRIITYLPLRLTDIELAYLDQSAESLHITRSDYLRNLLLEKPMIYKYEIVADNEQLKKLNAEIGKIGSNLNQITKHLNQGGVRSMILQDRVHECIDKLFDLRRQVMELAGDYYGDIEAQDK